MKSLDYLGGSKDVWCGDFLHVCLSLYLRLLGIRISIFTKGLEKIKFMKSF